jgi:hypothetical protein
LVDYTTINKGEKVSVDALKLTVEIKEVYIIKGVAYYNVNFMILFDS